jgi:isopentenyl phosphate kinase
LNRILVKKLIRAGEKAISVQPSAFIFCSKRKIKSFFLDPIKNYLKNDLVPVVFGDVISDEKFGCTILSTEEIFKFLAKFLKPKKIILMSDVEGVYDSKGKVIPEINKNNFSKIQNFLKGADKIDVTGGMAQKVKEAIEMAKGGIEVFIIGGKEGNLKRCLRGEKIGTRISF